MGDLKKYVKTVAKLNELTQDRNLLWSTIPDAESLNLGKDKPVKTVFQSDYKGKELRIYEETYKFWTDVDRFEWSNRIVLAIVGDDNENLWEFPSVIGITDLFESVRFQVANVDQFIDDLFSE